MEENESARSGGRGEELIPIEVCVYLNGEPVRVNLLWPSNESNDYVEIMAKIIMDDHGLNASAEAEITSQIKKVLEAHPKSMTDFAPDEEMLCVISFRISDGGVVFSDEFEWDLAEESNSPAAFSAQLVKEQNLPLHFEHLISFEIHKQLYAFRRFLVQSVGDEYAHRPKKARGLREGAVIRLGENLRLDAVTERTIFRTKESWEKWGPKLAFN